jgi:hypothetical protein
MHERLDCPSAVAICRHAFIRGWTIRVFVCKQLPRNVVRGELTFEIAVENGCKAELMQGPPEEFVPVFWLTRCIQQPDLLHIAYGTNTLWTPPADFPRYSHHRALYNSLSDHATEERMVKSECVAMKRDDAIRAVELYHFSALSHSRAETENPL